MTITIKLKTENAAFQDDPAGEVRRIVSIIADNWRQLHDGGTHKLRDYNGNTVGSLTVRGK